MWVEYKDGADLSRSHKRVGQYSPLTRDADNNLGQVTLSDIDEAPDSAANSYGQFDGYGTDQDARDRREDLAEMIALVARHFIDVGVAAATPHVKRWWSERAQPKIKSTNESLRNKFAKRRRAPRPTPDTEVVAFVDAATTDSPRDLEAAPNEGRLCISRDEAQQRLVAALVARAFSDEQLAVLLNARIRDDDGYLGLTGPVEQLTPQEVVDHVTLMLEMKPALLDEFVKLFRGEHLANGPRLAPRSEGLKEEPRPMPTEQ